jgi:hypothetical protein
LHVCIVPPAPPTAASIPALTQASEGRLDGTTGQPAAETGPPVAWAHRRRRMSIYQFDYKIVNLIHKLLTLSSNK